MRTQSKIYLDVIFITTVKELEIQNRMEESGHEPIEIIPRETLYINNINDKVSLNKLKRKLDEIFQKYGEIIQITAHKNLKMKGQAFITFKDIQSSTRAMEEEQESLVFGKRIHIRYAKTNSDNYFEKIAKDESPILQRKKEKEAKESSGESNAVAKLLKLKQWRSLPPNRILLLQNLNSEMTQDTLRNYFESYEGFINSRYIKARNLAFIEFENEESARSCLENTTDDDQKLNALGDEAFITYAKK